MQQEQELLYLEYLNQGFLQNIQPKKQPLLYEPMLYLQHAILEIAVYFLIVEKLDKILLNLNLL